MKNLNITSYLHGYIQYKTGLFEGQPERYSRIDVVEAFSRLIFYSKHWWK